MVCVQDDLHCKFYLFKDMDSSHDLIVQQPHQDSFMFRKAYLRHLFDKQVTFPYTFQPQKKLGKIVTIVSIGSNRWELHVHTRTHARTHTHAHTHAHTRTHTRARTHTQIYIYSSRNKVIFLPTVKLPNQSAPFAFVAGLQVIYL